MLSHFHYRGIEQALRKELGDLTIAKEALVVELYRQDSSVLGPCKAAGDGRDRGRRVACQARCSTELFRRGSRQDCRTLDRLLAERPR